MSEKLQVLFGSECSKGDMKAPRCVILVRESGVERSLRGASRDCSAQSSDDWEQRQFILYSSLSELEQIEGMTITIANSGRPKCLKRARQ